MPVGKTIRRRSRHASWTKGADPYDVELREEREAAAVPFTKSPFPKVEKGEEFAPLTTVDHKDLDEEVDEDALKVESSEEVEWIDLLLELAMTTAFANLADNTPLLTGKEASSYIAFFALVWWIWASQVAYNMRFRQADWFHRICAFLQLVVLCGMAAFTSDFDITVGLFKDSYTEQERIDQKVILGISESQQNATQFRLNKLPEINAKGIAFVMGCSRVLMLAQYAVVLWYARGIKRRSAILIHTGSLIFSALLFFISFVVITSTNRITSIFKLILWYSAVIFEVAVHFFANTLPGHVSYRSEAVYGRSSTLFVVVLGIGLDKITGQFQFVVGAVGFSSSTVFITLSIAIILIGLFALYFSSGSRMEIGDNRRLAYFFGHFPFMAAVIVLLRGVSTLLGFTNLYKAADKLVGLYTDLDVDFSSIDQCKVENLLKNSTNINRAFWSSGLSFLDWIEKWSKEICEPAVNLKNFTEEFPAIERSLVQLELEPIVFLFEQFEAMPESESSLGISIAKFQASNDTKLVNFDGFINLFSEMLEFRLTPALWFAGAGGFAIIMMGILTLSRQLPRDRWEWGSVITRFVGGSVYAALSFFNLKSGRPLVSALKDPKTGEATYETADSPSIVWKWAGSGWMLPSYALLLVVLNLISWILSWFARRSYRKWKRNSMMLTEEPKHTTFSPSPPSHTPTSGTTRYDDPYTTPPMPFPSPMTADRPDDPRRQSSAGSSIMSVTPASGAGGRTSSGLHYAYSS